MHKSSRILVTGATGFIGSYILRLLIDRGYTNVLAVRRPHSRMDLVVPVIEQVQWVEVDMLDCLGIYDLLKGVDAVIHAAAMVSFGRKDAGLLMKVNVEGTANLVNAALENQISKMVHVSSISVFSRKSGLKIDEETGFDYNVPNTGYAISKYRAEMEVSRAGSEGLPVAIINPSLVLGSGFWDQGTASLFKRIYRYLNIYPKGINGFVDVRDVAEAAVLLLEKPIFNERFIISGENRSYRDVTSMIARELNRTPPSIPLNPVLRELALLRSWTMRLLGDKEVVTRGNLINAQKETHFDTTKSREVLGLRYRPIETTIRESCAQLQEAARDGFRARFLPFD